MTKLTKVENLKKKPAAAASYNHIYVTMPDGNKQSLLFTDTEVQRAIYRAENNPEDLPSTSWLRSWF